MPTAKRTTAVTRKPRRPRPLTELKKRAREILDVVIVDQDGRDQAGPMLAAFQIERRTVEKGYRALLDPLNETRGVILAMKKEDLAVIQPCEQHLQFICGNWDAEQERIAEAAARALLPKAVETATEDRKQEVEALQEAGDTAAAVELARAPLQVDLSMVPVVPKLTDGFSTGAKTVEIELLDMKALVVAVAAGHVSVDALAINESHFREAADWYLANQPPGVKVSQRRGKIVFRGRPNGAA